MADHDLAGADQDLLTSRRTTGALDAGMLPCSGGEGRVLRIAASLAEGVPVDLREAVTGLDEVNAVLAAGAVCHAAGHRWAAVAGEARR